MVRRAAIEYEESLQRLVPLYRQFCPFNHGGSDYEFKSKPEICRVQCFITVEARFCRGDWSTPKTSASAATIGVAPEVIARIHRLESLTVDVRAGRAVRKHKVVKSCAPDDLVFQSVQQGKPMNDQNVLRRHIKPAARALGLSFVNWRCLRTSHATWLVQAGADPKSVQGQMRHSRISTTMEIYAQIVPLAQRRALEQLSAFAGNSRSKTVQ